MGDAERSGGDNADNTVKVLTAVFDNLKANADVKVDGPVRLFFPNGIELIDVTVKANLKEGVDVEVKIAGEKGIKSAALLTRRLAASSPVISLLDPSQVPVNWEGTVKIFGDGFDDASFALFDGAVPANVLLSATLLEVKVTKDITSTTGDKSVEVHTGAGSVSNMKTFTVK